MFLKKMKIAVVSTFLLFAFPIFVAAQPWQLIHGEIIQVHEKEGKILVDTGGSKVIYQLEASCSILREGAPAALASLRPITSDAYQDALLWLNPAGTISYIFVNYHTSEIDGILFSYDIFGNLKE